MADPSLERALHESLAWRGAEAAEAAGRPPRLHEAMTYAVFPGGARVRPRLCLEVARACGAVGPLVYAAACAVELLHCASLVHDDLPCFDGAQMRRGRPTVHHVFGEATALLAGDGLMLLAVETLAHSCAAHPSAGVRPVIRLLEAANARTGLVAGQAWELETRADVSVYHRAKTAALFEVAASLGALASGQDPSPFARFGLAFGMAYQHADDVADVFGSAEDLGKATGRDRELGRPSAVPSGSSRRLALQTLRKAAERVVDDVPTCPGDAALRNFTTAVFASLEKQCQAEQTNP